MAQAHFTARHGSDIMSYRFAIQASNPRFVSEFDVNDTNLSDAIQTVFPLETEYALLVWNWVYVPLTYKYDLSLMVDDMIGLVEVMISEPSGNLTIQWPSNTFAATWRIGWDSGTTKVQAEWLCVLGDTEAMLATKPNIVVQTADFIAEWRRPLEVIVSGLDAAGYNATNLPGIGRLQALVGKIGHCGMLYREWNYGDGVSTWISVRRPSADGLSTGTASPDPTDAVTFCCLEPFHQLE
jgi:hypothetical protein